MAGVRSRQGSPKAGRYYCSDFEIVIFFYYRDLNLAVGPTLYSGWYYRGLNVAVGPTLGQRLKV